MLAKFKSTQVGAVESTLNNLEEQRPGKWSFGKEENRPKPSFRVGGFGCCSFSSIEGFGSSSSVSTSDKSSTSFMLLRRPWEERKRGRDVLSGSRGFEESSQDRWWSLLRTASSRPTYKRGQFIPKSKEYSMRVV